MRNLLRVAVSCLAGLMMTLPVNAAPPTVSQATPDNGATNVEPGARELRIVFDQPMNRGGYSIVGGGPKFPKLLGRPRWVNDRTLTVMMQLEPDHEYALSINSQTFTNFRSAQGEPAVPYPITFTTVAKKEAVKLTAEVNRKSIEQLRTAIDQNYSHRDLAGLDWDKLFKESAATLEGAQTPLQFAQAAGKMLAKAEDLHIWLEAGGQTIGSHRRMVSPNINTISVSQAVPGWTRRSSMVYSGRFEDGIGYILIAGWDGSRAEDIDAAFDALKEYADTKGLIVDVRPNSGGDERLAQQFAGCFIDQPKAYAKNVYRENGKLTAVLTRSIEPNRDRPTYRGKVVVLMGIANMSSCESFLMMMQQVPGCKLVGQKSYGSSGNPKPAALENGVVVYLPSWRDLRLDGTCIEREGIKPDVEVKTEPKDFLTGDPVLEAGLKLLRNGNSEKGK